jgi:serine/threonine-protein kinase
MIYDREGRLVFTSLDHRILAIDTGGMIRVIAGTGTAGFSGDGGPARAAQLNTPYGLAIAPNGDLVFADAGNKRLRKIDARTGVIRTIAE